MRSGITSRFRDRARRDPENPRSYDSAWEQSWWRSAAYSTSIREVLRDSLPKSKTLSEGRTALVRGHSAMAGLDLLRMRLGPRRACNFEWFSSRPIVEL